MGSSNDVQGINERSTADVYAFLRVFLQDGDLPGILSKLAVSVHIDWILDSAVDALRMPRTTLSVVVTSLSGHMGAQRPSAADVS